MIREAHVAQVACPACGEEDDLSGVTGDDGISIRCGPCGAEWTREDSCRSCGGTASLLLHQAMTRNPRGTLSAIIGKRQVRLCPTCDVDAVRACRQDPQAVIPESYVSRFVYGRVEEPTPRRRPASTSRPAARTSTRSSRPSPAPRSTPPPAPPPTHAAPPTVTNPTIRWATSEFLTQAAESSDSMVMVVFGMKWGPSTRLQDFAERAPQKLADWLDDQFGAGGRDQAAAAVRRAAEFWAAQGWLEAQHLETITTQLPE